LPICHFGAPFLALAAKLGFHQPRNKGATASATLGASALRADTRDVKSVPAAAPHASGVVIIFSVPHLFSLLESACKLHDIFHGCFQEAH
jgi:hypothetical protein